MADIPTTNQAQKTQPDYTLDDAINSAEMFNEYVNKWVVSPLANLGGGVAGFIFDIMGEEKIEMTADATDHYVEKNVAMQDHIALKPTIITLRGYVGEKVYKTTKDPSKVQKLGQKLTTIVGFLPLITDTAKSLQQGATDAKKSPLDAVDAGISAGVDVYGAYKKLQKPKTKQAQAFYFFKSLMSSKQLVAVETPQGGFYNKMAIIGLTAIQPENTQMITDFTITLKEIRQATTKLKTYDPKKDQGRTAGQKADEADKGKGILDKMKDGAKTATDKVKNWFKGGA